MNICNYAKQNAGNGAWTRDAAVNTKKRQKQNQLVKLIAKTLRLSKSAVNLKSSHISRRKVLEVCGSEASAVAALASV